MDLDLACLEIRRSMAGHRRGSYQTAFLEGLNCRAKSSDESAICPRDDEKGGEPCPEFAHRKQGASVERRGRG